MTRWGESNGESKRGGRKGERRAGAKGGGSQVPPRRSKAARLKSDPKGEEVHQSWPTREEGFEVDRSRKGAGRDCVKESVGRQISEDGGGKGKRSAKERKERGGGGRGVTLWEASLLTPILTKLHLEEQKVGENSRFEIIALFLKTDFILQLC